jgi:hypothetical protein
MAQDRQPRTDTVAVRVLWWLAQVGVILIAGAVAGAFALTVLPAIDEPSATALQFSVADEVDGEPGIVSHGCTSVRNRHVWRCEVWDSSDSGGADYRVEMDGRACWRGRRLGPSGGEQPFPGTVDGCVRLNDQTRLFYRLFGI